MISYKNDFGGSDQNLIEFIYRYLDNPEIDMQQAEQRVSEKSLWIMPLID